jgi:hypothetical protein
MTKLPRTLRLDPSDTFVFAHPAEPGEWAVTGSFLFLDADPANLDPKSRAAFRAGFVGVESLGFSTLVVVAEASPEDRAGAVEALARHVHERLGAPSLAAARAAAEEEVAFAASLCGHPVNTVLALRRSLEGGEVREEFRTLTPRERNAGGADRLHAHARAFEFVEADDEDGPEERVDLVGMMRGGEDAR